jgi:hypothetical protein
MSAPAGMFGPTSLQDLKSRTEYEAWLLEAVYDITDQRIAVENVDELIFEPSGTPPTQTIYVAGAINLGDWRPGFLRAGAPLVFATAFKLLDMLLEWVLAENGYPSTSRFVEKIAALKAGVQFPALVDARPWLRERLIALYVELEPLRGTLIHERHFKSTDGGVEVSSSKRGVLGPVVVIGPDDLQKLALVLVSLLRYLEGTWTMDEFREKRIRHALDRLTHLHACSSLGQLPPGFLNVRVYVPEDDSVMCDLARIRREVAAKRPNQDVMFDLRVVAVAQDGSGAAAYLIPWSRLQAPAPILTKLVADLSSFVVTPPDGLDLMQLSADLARRGALAP